VLTIPREEPTLNAPLAPALTFELRHGEHVLARVVDGDGTEREIVPVHSRSVRVEATAGS
jgi:hypothetical protein